MIRTLTKHGVGLIEVAIGIVVAGVLIGSVYQVLVTNQRMERSRTVPAVQPTSLEAGLDMLARELREISPSGGDLLTAGPDEISFRAPAAFGIACAVLGEAPVTLAVVPQGRPFDVGDAVFVYVEDARPTGGGGRWVSSQVRDVLAGRECGENGAGAQTLVFSDESTPSDGAEVEVGAFIRGWEPVRYFVDDVGGSPFLVYDRDGRTTPLVGPLVSERGLELTYLDVEGETTSDPAAVRTARITLRTREGSDGAGVTDSLSTVVSLRN